MQLKLIVTGEEAALSVGLDKFVRQHGYTEGDKLEFACNVLKKFMRDSIEIYVRGEARNAATAATEAALAQLSAAGAAAETAAAAQLGAVLDSTETVLIQE